jgi:FHA domain
VAEPEPASTDDVLAAGAMAPAAAPESAPEPAAPEATRPWQAPAQAASGAANVAETIVPNDVAATMTADAAEAARDSTTLMPVWSPPAPPPAAGGLPDTMPIGGFAQAPSTAVPGSRPQAELTIESGPDAGHTHRAGDSALRLGRSPDNDVILRDPATSGHHARLERRGDQFWIVDLGSTNGTLVNGDPIQEKQLSHGDRVTIGQNAVHFSVLGA